MSTRVELIAKVKENQIATPRPPHMMKTEELQEIVSKALSAKVTVSQVTLKSRIEQLHSEGLAPKDIQDILVGEGWGNVSRVRCGEVRMIYIKFVIKNLQK
jgi:mRNA-degrading endonuclease RelE of RelBE toxin-antitoxin system